ncbi:universal stress protein [Pseudomonas nitroreducens]|uniref:universal stress protein n=1 Tax=Pseudomonas nitroreducens TaxID=46680 RepID=UPI003D29C989
MNQYQKVFLVAAPHWQHSAAYRRALAIVRRSNASLHIGMFFEPRLGLPFLIDHLRDELLAQCRAELEREAEELRGSGLIVTCEAVWSADPCKEILERVAMLEADLVIKNVHHEPALRRVFVTPLDYRLLRACQVPLHLVAQAPHPLPLKIAAALDVARPELLTSGLNEGILQAARNMASLCGAELHLLHSCDLPTAIEYDSAMLSSSWDTSYAEQVRISLYQTFNHVADKWGIPAERRHFVLGPAAQEITSFMNDHQIDVMVLGMQRRLGLDRILGSTTERLLYHVSGSLLAVGADAAGHPRLRQGIDVRE